MLGGCPECGAQVSDKALACPNCGYSFNRGLSGIWKAQLVLASLLCLCSLCLMGFAWSNQLVRFGIQADTAIKIGASGLIVGLVWFAFVRIATA